MSQKMSLNFYNDPEHIRDHMVDFLSSTGSVSKTLFGIELGTVCKTPNRGRTKLVVDTYPEVFKVEGDNIGLKNAPMRQSSTPIFDSYFGEPYQQGELIRASQCSMYSEPQMGYASPMPSQQLSQCSMYSEPLNEELVHTSPQASQQLLGCYGPPSVTSHMSVPLQDNSSPALLSPSPSYNQLDVKMQQYVNPFPLSPFENMVQSPYGGSPMQYPNMFQYENQINGFQHVNNEGEAEVEAESASQLSSGENWQCVPASEATVLEILNKNGGSMEIADLVINMGISPSDSAEQGKLYTLLSNCSSIGIEGDEIYTVCGGAGLSEGEHQLVMEPTMEALPEREHRQPSQISKQNSAGQNEKEEEDDKEDDNKRDRKQEESSASKEGSAKTVRVGSISIQNINISTLNLHLHVDDSKNSQVSELLKFQSMLQDMISAKKQSA